ncbi:MAG: hypothetical protein IPK26_08565 [Planctomycetes bacterium]|nr:hypothetical protein [Planctomycetota bacterium]
MKFVPGTQALRWALGLGFLATLALKIGAPAVGVQRFGWVGYLSIVAVEVSVVLLLMLGRLRLAAATSGVFCFLGGLAAVLSDGGCACLGGVVVSRGQHLLLAGGLGLVSVALFLRSAKGVSASRGIVEPRLGVQGSVQGR